MEVSPNELRKQTVQVYSSANTMLGELAVDGGLPALEAAKLKASLLQTKSQCLNTLVLLSTEASKPRVRHRSDRG